MVLSLCSKTVPPWLEKDAYSTCGTHSNIDPRNFNTHSFRIRAATTAAHSGTNQETIQRLGRWRSKAVQTYIRPGTNQMLVWGFYCIISHTITIIIKYCQACRYHLCLLCLSCLFPIYMPGLLCYLIYPPYVCHGYIDMLVWALVLLLRAGLLEGFIVLQHISQTDLRLSQASTRNQRSLSKRPTARLMGKQRASVLYPRTLSYCPHALAKKWVLLSMTSKRRQSVAHLRH
jgi:hypothetical protein